ncbi:MAG TPA: DUF721 domain-containing protein [Deltaproteobacteria bacterium]|nr:DUF721 domain-containing protein [Deltaproteobacteria bacterium]
MRRIGEVLGLQGRIITRVKRVRDRWPEIAGDVLASHAEPVLVRSGTLHVLCDSPAWVQQINLLTGLIRERVQKMTGLKITRIEASFGVSRSAPEARRLGRVRFRPDIDPAAVDRIRDPQLARLVRALAEAADEADD